MKIKLGDQEFTILPKHQKAFIDWMDGLYTEFTCSNWAKSIWVSKDPLGVNDFAVDVEYFTEESFTFRTAL